MYNLIETIEADQIRNEQNKHCYGNFENCTPAEIQSYKERINMLELDIARETMLGNIENDETLQTIFEKEKTFVKRR